MEAARTYSPASDRYALGAVAYFALTRQQPPREHDPRLLRQRLESVPDLRGRPELVDHVLDMMAEDPQARPTSAAAWARQFSATSSSFVPQTEPRTAPGAVPITSVRPSSIEPTRRRRRLWLAAVATAIVVAVGASAAWALSRDDGDPEVSATPGDTDGSTTAAASTTTAAPDTTALATTTEAATTTSTTAAPTTTTSAPTTTTVPPATTTVPPATTTAPTTAAPPPTSAPTLNFLTEDQRVEDGGLLTGEVKINAVQYRHAWYGQVYRTTQYADFDLNRGRQRFQATAGVLDSSLADTHMRFEVFADGQSVWVEEGIVGQSFIIDLDVTGVLRLRLSVTGLATEQPCCARTVGGFGDPVVS